MIGTTFNELMRTVYAEKELAMNQARERLAASYGDEADAYIALFEKAYPNFTPQDLLSIDTRFRPLTISVADARSAQSDAPVYAYLLTWKSPVEDSTKGSFHGVDIPLAFNNIELGKHWTGDGEDAVVLAGKMSAAWTQFAKTGNPNVESVLPAWNAYTQDNGEIMLLDTACMVVNNHDHELMEFIQSRQAE